MLTILAGMIRMTLFLLAVRKSCHDWSQERSQEERFNYRCKLVWHKNYVTSGPTCEEETGTRDKQLYKSANENLYNRQRVV